MRKVLVVYNPRLPPSYTIPDSIPHELLQFKDCIMYKNYYRLLQWIDKKTLVISDELMIMDNRYALEYNCFNAFMNQTPQRLVFSYLPFINNQKDFMILLDQYNSALYKGEQYEPELLKHVVASIKPVHFTTEFIHVPVSDDDKEKYLAERDKRFAEIGLRDPDTIPNNLMLLASDLRAKSVDSHNKYLCRNLRFKKLCCTTYKENELNIIMDFPIKRQDFISVLTASKQTHIRVLTSDLSIDRWHEKDLQDWIQKLEDFYAETALS